MTAPTIISGQVLDEQGHPVEQARVSFGSGPGEVPDIAALTDNEGRFTLSAPTPGEYTIVTAADGYVTAETVVDVTEARSPELRIELREAA